MRAGDRTQAIIEEGNVWTLELRRGILSIAFCFLRRRFDALLVWLATFAALYGLRMWMNASMLRIVPQSLLFDRLRSSMEFLIPIPAFNFFRLAGFLGRGGKVLVLASRMIFPTMFVIALVFGPLPVFYPISALVVIYALWLLLMRSLGNKSQDRDFAAVRIGVLCFAALALWDNLVDRLAHNPSIPAHVEPYGFAIMLACLGYVAARRAPSASPAAASPPPVAQQILARQS